MTLTADRPTWLWASLAVASGLAIALLPLQLAVIVLGGAILGVVFYLEPTLSLVFMLCVAPLKTLIETEAPSKLPLDIGQLAFVLYVGFWILRYVVDGKPRLYIPVWLVGGVVVFILGVSLSLWTAYSPAGVVKETVKWVQILVLLVLVANTARWEWVVVGVVLSGVLQAIVGIWEFRGGSGAAHLWIIDYRFFRAFGTFGQPNPFGAFMGMVLPLVFGVILGYIAQIYTSTVQRRENIVLCLLCMVCGGILLLGLLTSWSRGAWLGFIGASAVMLWSFPRQRWLGTIAILGGGGLLLVLAPLGVLPATLTNRLTSFTHDLTNVQDVRGVVISNENFAVIERLAHWQAAGEMAKTSPWLGVGFGNYEIAYPHFALINWQFALGHAHNYYLNLLAETGIIGLLAYLVMWGIIFALSWQLLQTSQDWRLRGVAVGLLGTWTHISIHSLLDKLYVNNLFLHVGVMVGLLAVLYRTAYRDDLIHLKSH